MAIHVVLNNAKLGLVMHVVTINFFNLLLQITDQVYTTVKTRIWCLLVTIILWCIAQPYLFS